MKVPSTLYLSWKSHPHPIIFIEGWHRTRLHVQIKALNSLVIALHHFGLVLALEKHAGIVVEEVVVCRAFKLAIAQ